VRGRLQPQLQEGARHLSKSVAARPRRAAGGAHLAALRDWRPAAHLAETSPMETPLTPLEFARRAGQLYPDREALIDGDLRLTYRQFFARCDRWSAALQALGVRHGDRVVVIAPNTHAMLEQFYAVPAPGAILVPPNSRLSAGDFRYMIEHCEPVVVCAHEDYIDVLEGMRPELKGVRHFVALEGERSGWLDYEATLAAAAETVVR